MNPDRVTSILLIRPSALGDVCRTVPVLASLRARWPDARIDWLVRTDFAPVIAEHPALTDVVPFPRHELGRALRRARLGTVIRWLRDLRSRRYDIALDCQGLARSGLLALASGAPTRVGHADARELGWLALNRRHRVDPDLHTVDRMLALARAAGADPVTDMRLYVPAADRQRAARDPSLQAPYVLLAPTSRWEGKRWPIERFVELARRLVSRSGVRVVVVGAPSDRAWCAPLIDLAAHDSRVVDLVGSTTVGGLMAAVERAAVVVACDSAALHLAVGLRRPIVALFGPTRVDRVGPYGRESDVIQHVGPGDRLDLKDAAAGRALMERISVDEVELATDQRLAPVVGSLRP